MEFEDGDFWIERVSRKGPCQGLCPLAGSGLPSPAIQNSPFLAPQSPSTTRNRKNSNPEAKICFFLFKIIKIRKYFEKNFLVKF